MSMKMYTVNAITSLHEGRVVLSKEQARRRRHNIRHIEGDVYEVVKPVQFKVGEKVGLDDSTLKKVHLVNLAAEGEEETEKSAEGKSKTAKDAGTQNSGKQESSQKDSSAKGANSDLPEDLESLPWQKIKELVEARGGKWDNKPKGIEFLKSQKKNGG